MLIAHLLPVAKGTIVPVYTHSPRLIAPQTGTYDPEGDGTALFILGQSRCDGVVDVIHSTKAF
jgi:hypothetical protein